MSGRSSNLRSTMTSSLLALAIITASLAGATQAQAGGNNDHHDSHHHDFHFDFYPEYHPYYPPPSFHPCQYFHFKFEQTGSGYWFDQWQYCRASHGF